MGFPRFHGGQPIGAFWTYDKAKFLEQPVYSRDFTPCQVLRIAAANRLYFFNPAASTTGAHFATSPAM